MKMYTFEDEAEKTTSTTTSICASATHTKRTVQGSFKNGNLITENGLLSKANLDPKLVQVAQLFVQDLINRARVEVQRKNPEQQALLHDETNFYHEDENNLVRRIRAQVVQKCRRFLNLFVNCMGTMMP